MVAALATHALPDAAAGIAMMLLFNVGAAALLLPLPLGMGVARCGRRGDDRRIPLERRSAGTPATGRWPKC